MLGFFKSGSWDFDQRLQDQWDRGVEDIKIHPMVKFITLKLDEYAGAFGFYGVGITSLIRPKPGKPTFHWIGQAADFRTWGWNEKFIKGVDRLLSAWKTVYPKLDWEWEEDHLHIEWDDDNPIVKGGK